MPLSRRHLLAAIGGTALTLAVRPVSAMAGILDRIFHRPAATPTKPITPNDEFYITSYRSPPTIRIDDWSLSITGLVERPLTLTYGQLLSRPTASQIVTLECVGNTVAGEFLSTAAWEGLPLRSLLEEAGARGEAFDVVFRAADGFSDSIRFDRAMTGDVMIAHKMNGEPLPLGHGFPARMIVPGHYGMKSVQWLTQIDVVGQDYKGYYAQKGWTDEAVIKTTSRIDLPEHGSTLKGLYQKVEGLAFAGIRGIKQVEISTDEGEQWTNATIEPPLSAASWIFWSFDWMVPKPGRHTLLVRATDGAGQLQTAIEQGPAPDGATGLHEVTVIVEG